MYRLDKNGNIIAVTQFETALAELLLQHYAPIRLLFNRINQALIQLIEANQADRGFDRMLYSVMSNFMCYDFPFVKDETYFKMPDADLVASETFHKIFVEQMFSHVKVFPEKPKPKKVLPLFMLALGQLGEDAKATQRLRPKHLFSLDGRGRLESGEDMAEEAVSETQKFGICADEYTPARFKTIFAPYISGAISIRKIADSSTVQRMARYKMPFVGGIAGTVSVLIPHIAKLSDLSLADTRCYVLAISACTVARNSHSFYEVFKASEALGARVTYSDDIEQMYAQMLPKAVLEMPAYQSLMKTLKESLGAEEKAYQCQGGMSLKNN